MGKNIKSILLVLLILFLFGFVSFYSKMSRSGENGGPLTDNPFSPLGCYVAKLGQDVYVLKIDTEDRGNVAGVLAYNNYQKDSSSGVFTGAVRGDVLLGDYSFNSEGMHSIRQVIFKRMGESFVQGFGEVKVVGNKETFADTDQITYDRNSTFVKDEDCLENFTDTGTNVSFSHNSFFKVSEGDKVPVPDWRVNARKPGVVLADLFVPSGYLPNTNFINGHLMVGRSNEIGEIISCTTPDMANSEASAGPANISGYPFTKITSTGAAAGNLYQTTSYRGIVDGDCYVVEYTIHSANIENYSPDQGIKEFDKLKITSEFENIIKSLKFLINSD